MSNLDSSINLPDPGRILSGLGGAAGAATAHAETAVPGVSNVTDTVKSFSGLANNLTNPGFWKRFGVGALGVWLCWIGVLIILGTSDAVRSSISTVTAVATKGVVK